MQTLRAPFPWFGGKSRVAHIVWERFGNTPNYVEPFAGSLAVLLGRPHAPSTETVNDKDCYVANFWRALRDDPAAVAQWCDWPVNEADLHARHLWLVNREAFREHMKTDPDYYDAKIAGWWVWGICQWIGSGWCIDARHHKRPDLHKSGRGVHRKTPSIGGTGRGVARKIPRISSSGDGVKVTTETCLLTLANRLRSVRVCCGEWHRIIGPSPTEHVGLTAVFLDPPYSAEAWRDGEIYAEEDLSVAHDVREWAVAHGDNPMLRIALCGYEGEHAMPANWECVAWKAAGGFGNQRRDRSNENRTRERIWFSPHCLKQAALF